jgi:hypothetical protein
VEAAGEKGDEENDSPGGGTGAGDGVKTVVDIYMLDKVSKAANLKKIVTIPQAIGETSTIAEVRALFRRHGALAIRE